MASELGLGYRDENHQNRGFLQISRERKEAKILQNHHFKVVSASVDTSTSRWVLWFLRNFQKTRFPRTWSDLAETWAPPPPPHFQVP